MEGESYKSVIIGGLVARANEIVHGKPSPIRHDGRTIFRGLENPFQADRYHSLTGKKIPDCLEVSASSADEPVMAVRHKHFFIEGVQFRPESILTTNGGQMIKNLLEISKNH